MCGFLLLPLINFAKGNSDVVKQLTLRTQEKVISVQAIVEIKFHILGQSE